MIRFIIAALALLGVAGPARAADATDLTELTARLMPSVVSITSIRASDVPAKKGEAAAVVRRRARGTGFVISADGLIVTNRHVIAGATDITVTLSDGTNLAATLLAQGIIDIALLRVEPDAPLQPTKWGDSSKLKPGQPILAIGNPLGYAKSVTTGIVSALERDISTSPYDDYIQSDAMINQGNSGGPLFNLDGEVVGVNTALQAQNDGGSIGISFSIPSNEAQFVVERLVKYGRVRRGWVGVDVQALTPAIAEAAGMPRDQFNARGVIVTDLQAESVATSKLLPSDVIVGVGTAAVSDSRTFNRAVSALVVGTTAKFDVWRIGKRIEVEVSVGDAPDSSRADLAVANARLAQNFIDPPDLGLGLAPLTPELRQRYDIADTALGVLVLSVDGKSKASEAGIEPGDMIVQVRGEQVNSVREFWMMVDTARRERRTRLLILIKGPTGIRWVALPSA